MRVFFGRGGRLGTVQGAQCRQSLCCCEPERSRIPDALVDVEVDVDVEAAVLVVAALPRVTV
jgi:hypothetical protein